MRNTGPNPPNSNEPVENDSQGPLGNSDSTVTGRLVEILDGYLLALKQGQAPSQDEILAQYPELAGQLQACLAGIEFIQGAAASEQSKDAVRLADFRIVREVGRGGMGAVYEAEQISLGRRVALKILRFGAVTNTEAIERFKREAETIANLHHTNIVPIYSFGCENGINYYAMQFIEGRSLDQVLAQSSTPLDVQTVVAWALQAADALEHAHQRHVVHRDVKPSNLILGDDGRVWLTDFGLAKRLDDVTLSVTGALLGTPRYMSPEQADSAQRTIDDRSDLYSLGASLYELLTGQPVFVAETYHGVIRKILEEQPRSLRGLRPEIPRDLDTIVLKLLAKDPRSRYRSAGELAEDLRAFSQGRSIHARRASLVEQAGRWLRRNRRVLLRSAITAAASAALVLAAIFGWRAYAQSQMASLALSCDAPLVAEIVDSSGRSQPVTLPTQQPVDVVAGDVELLFSGDRVLAPRYHLQAVPGQSLRFQVPVKQGRADARIPLHDAYRLLTFATGVDVVLLNDQQLARRDLVSNTDVWSIDSRDIWNEWAAENSDRVTPGRTPRNWDLLGELDDRQRQRMAASVVPTLDLDGDDEPDVLLVDEGRSWIMAVSGQDASLLWCRPLPDDDARFADDATSGRSRVLGRPVPAGDINGDGVGDVVISVGTLMVGQVEPKFAGEPERRSVHRSMIALSGSDGSSLWLQQLNDDWFQLVEPQQVPIAFRRHGDRLGGVSWGGSVGSRRSRGMLFRTSEFTYQLGGTYGFFADKVAPINASTNGRETTSNDTPDVRLLGGLAGTHLVAWRSDDGAIAATVDTQLNPLQPAIWRDVDGDEMADAILIDRLPTAELRCSVWSIAKQQKLWEHILHSRFTESIDAMQEAPSWPVVADVDGDQIAEVLVPTLSSELAENGSARAPWGEIALLNGADGKVRWTRRLFSVDQQIDHMMVGPDLDGDGSREIFAAALWGEDFDLYLDALSGADGHSIWWSRQPLPRDASRSAEFRLEQLKWWSIADDHLPQLMAHVTDSNGSDRPFCVVASSANGETLSNLQGASDVVPAAIDDHGTRDLLAFYEAIPGATDEGAEMRVIQGDTASWRRLAGPDWAVVHDLDGDGIRDLIAPSQGGVHHAISGRRGDVLWETTAPLGSRLEFPQPYEFSDGRVIPNAGSHDLDGDGTPDLIAWQRTGAGSGQKAPILAISGRTGQTLWNADIWVHVMEAALCLETHDMDGDGHPEVVIIAAMDWGYGSRRSFGTNDQQLWIAVLNGQNGRVVWKHALSAAYGTSQGKPRIPYQFGNLTIACTYLDLDGDGIDDIIVPAEKEERRLAYRALTGSNGKQLWQHALPVSSVSRPFHHLYEMTLADLDGDSEPELLGMAFQEQPNGQSKPTQRTHHLFALDQDGSVMWDWSDDSPGLYDQYHDDPIDRRGPVVLRGSNGRLNVSLPFTSAKQWIVLDHQGEPIVRYETGAWTGHRVWPVDRDADGVDEVLLTDEESIRAYRLGPEMAEVWRANLTDQVATRDAGRSLRIVTYEPANAERAGTLWVRSRGGANAVWGIDVRNGGKTWYCPGTSPSNRFGTIEASVKPLAVSATTTPFFAFLAGHTAQGRFATRVEGADRRHPVRGAVAGTSSESFHAARRSDPRLSRQLPWVPTLSTLVRDLRKIWLLGIAMSAALIILPGAYLLLLMERPRWSLVTFAALPLVVSLFLLAALSGDATNVSLTLVQKLILATLFVPIIALILGSAYLVATRQWSRLGRWVSIALTVSIGLAIIALYFDRRGIWLPGEHYEVSGWRWLGLSALYLLGVMMVRCIPPVVWACRDGVNRSMQSLISPAGSSREVR